MPGVDQRPDAAVPANELDHLRLAATLAGIPSEPVLPAAHHVVIGRIRLHYLDWGTAGRPAVLFLHGGCLTAHTWDLICLALRGDYHCLALDQRGHGDSDWPAALEYGAQAHVGDVAGWVDHLGLARFVLVGQSMGALNALAYACRHAGRLAGVVAIDIGAEFRWTDGARRIVDFSTHDTELDSVEAFVGRALAFNPARDPRLLRRSLLHNLHRLPNGRFTWKYDPRPLRDFVEQVPRRFAEIRAAAHCITCPALVVRGARSDVIDHADAAALAAVLPNGRWVEVDGAGHTVQGDNPRGLAEVLGSFLAEVHSPAPACR